MGSHLTVISYLRKMEAVFETIAFNVQQPRRKDGQDMQHLFIRCQDPVQLYELVLRAGRQLARLDLVGHGSPTRFWLGDEILLEKGRKPHPVLQQLAGELSKDVEVRILGCMTGIGLEGQSLLQSASEALGNRTVLGTTARVEPEHFGPTGLKEGFRAFHSSRAPDIASPLPSPASSHLKSASGHNRSFAHLRTLDEPDLDALLHWKQYFPMGYEPLGRGQPLARADFSVQHQGTRVTFACDCRLVLIEDAPGKPPLLMGWSSPEPVPFLPSMMQFLEASSVPDFLFAPADMRAAPRVARPRAKRSGTR